MFLHAITYFVKSREVLANLKFLLYDGFAFVPRPTLPLFIDSSAY